MLCRGSPSGASGPTPIWGNTPAGGGRPPRRTTWGYESLLERDRLMLADFDPAVTATAGQPFD